MTGTAAHQPARGDKTKTAQSAGNQVRSHPGEVARAAARLPEAAGGAAAGASPAVGRRAAPAPARHQPPQDFLGELSRRLGSPGFPAPVDAPDHEPRVLMGQRGSDSHSSASDGSAGSPSRVALAPRVTSTSCSGAGMRLGASVTSA